jgi:glycosyltransferase involved in cell wall biosynthesis
VVYSEDNLGFGPGNNLGMAHSSGDILLFLNNDTEPQQGWLEAIVDVFDNDDRVGVVGSKLLFPNMTVQHAGIAFKQPGRDYAAHPLLGYPRDHPQVNIRRELLAVTGACMAIRRRIFKELGGFDDKYIRGYYEDSDLCMKVRELGYKVVYEPDSVVIHKVGSSFSKLGALRELDFYIHNENTFRGRWDSKLLNNEYMFHGQHHYEPGRRNICILNSNMETYGGGEREAICAARVLEDDNNVDIIMRLPNEVTRKSIRRNLGIKLEHTELVTLLSAEPIHLYRDYDIFWNNEWKSNEPGRGNYNILRVMFPHQHDDLTFLDTYDKILANSKYTQEYISEYWGVESEVLYPPVTMMAELHEVDTLLDSKLNYVLTVGRFFSGEHCKKHKVMIEAFKELDLPDWEFHIAGVVKDNPQDRKYYEECVELTRQCNNMVFHPNISYTDLRALYRSSKIYWHATGFGEDDPLTAEHFGIAPVEAMSAGCYPVLISRGGLPEICDGDNTWSTTCMLIDRTRWLDKWDPGFLPEMKIARKFSADRYMDRIIELTGLGLANS